MELTPTHLAARLQAPLPLVSLAEHIRDQAQAYADHGGVVLGTTRMRDDGTWQYNGEAGLLSRHALAQLCSRLTLPTGGTVPASYLARCPAPLAASNLNHWLQQRAEADDQAFVRTKALPSGPAVRAVLSPRFAPVDHLAVVQALEAAVPRFGLTVQSWALDDEHLTLRLTVGSNHPATLKDPLRVGVHISNSEVGLGRITIAAFITRLVCSNGLVIKLADLGGVSRRHIGRAGESLDPLVRMGMVRVLDQANHACERFVALRERPVTEPMDDFIRKTNQRSELPEDLPAQVLPHLEGETLYDVINAFTRAAQDLPVAERVRVETAMSCFLSLN